MAGTGSLEFAMAPAGIHAMNVKMSDNFGKGVASFFRMPEPRMSVNTIGTWEFKSAPWAGQTFITRGKNAYTGRNVPGYTLPAVENPSGGKYENKTINQAWAGRASIYPASKQATTPSSAPLRFTPKTMER